MDVLREDTLNWDILLNNVMINGEFISKSKHINVHAQLSCLQRIRCSEFHLVEIHLFFQ